MKIISKSVLTGGLLTLALFFSAAEAQNQPAAAAQAAPAANADNGKKLYIDIGCWQCHGYSGQGGGGAKLAPDPIPLAGFTRYVRKPANSMPPYSEKVVTDAQLADIYAFLKTIPKPPDSKSIPMLNSN